MLIYFIDNDVILKLSAYNLFWETINSLNANQKNLRVLPTASKVINGTSREILQYKPESRHRAKQVADGCSSIQLAPSSLEYQSLLAEEGIDVGEALLVAATQAEQDFYLLTGDKRFLKALAVSELHEIKQRLRHRIFCLEQLILNVISFSGFDKACRRIASTECCDQVVKDAFCRGKQTKPEYAVNVLAQCVEELRLRTGELLVERLPCNDLDQERLKPSASIDPNRRI